MHRTLRQLFFVSTICTCLYAADSLPPIPDVAATAAINAAADIEEEALPVSPLHTVSSLILDAELNNLRSSRKLPGCKVAPLSEIWDPETLAFEKNSETSPVNVDGLMPDTALALDNFKDLVASVGGTFDLKSAYRPPAYQAHLHEVWIKWVKQLRNNRSAGCRALREEVGAEFAGHQLLIRQQPVSASDHTRGLAFDAAVFMPRAARLKGKRVNVDKLAALAGTKRPDRRHDPVHFKLIPERPQVISYAKAPNL